MRALLVCLVLILVTYGQIVIKFGTTKLGPMPLDDAGGFLVYVWRAFTNFYIVSGLFAAFLAALAWIATVSRFDLSGTYPFLSLNFILVPVLAMAIFGESFSLPKIVGCVVIVIGVFVFARGI